MSWPDIFLLCFAIGSLWALMSLLLGGLHLGHGHSGHMGHAAHAGHIAHAGGAHAHAGHSIAAPKALRASSENLSYFGSMANPSCAAVFLAWFGGVGYLLTRHSGLAFWLDLVLAAALGLFGAWILAAFLRFLQSREQPLNPADYEMVGVLGQVSCAIRDNGTGELIYVRDGARKAIPARSEEPRPISRGEEVVVVRYEKGIAYVKTWEAMTQPASPSMTRPASESKNRMGSAVARPETLHKETENVE